MTLYEAVSSRKSIRRYKKDAIPESMLGQIEAFTRSVSVLDDQIRYQVSILDNTGVRVRAKGLFKVDAPYYLLYCSEEKKGFEQNAGYILEQVVLYLTTKGLGCCYLGGTKVNRHEPGMKQVMVVSFGYSDEFLYRDQGMAKRQHLKDLCVFKEEVEEPVKILLKAARLAPSSFNSQPWRFLIYRNRICVFACRDTFPMPTLHSMRHINIGIVLSHLMIAAEELWMDARFVQEEVYRKKNYQYGDYMTTIMLQ